MAIVHSKAEREQSWRYLGLNKEEFNTRIQYDTIVAPGVEAFRKTDARKKRCLEDIKKVWGEEWKAKADPAGTIIPHDSERTQGLTRRISGRVTAEGFGVVLAQAIDERLKNWGNGRRTGNRGTLTDLVRVEAKLATVPPPLPELKKRKLIGGAPKTPTDTSTNTDSTSDAKSDTETYKDSDSPPKKKTKLTKGVENTEEPVSATKTTKKKAQITAVFATCGCKNKKEAKTKLEIAKKNGPIDQKLLVRSIEYLRPEKIPEFCWNHLRDFCTAVGLKKQVGRREELVERLEKLWKKRYELGKMTTEPETKDWFTMPLRGRVPEDKLASLRFIPTPHEKPTFYPAVVMQRYVDAETIKELDRD